MVNEENVTLRDLRAEVQVEGKRGRDTTPRHDPKLTS